MLSLVSHTRIKWTTETVELLCPDFFVIPDTGTQEPSTCLNTGFNITVFWVHHWCYTCLRGEIFFNYRSRYTTVQDKPNTCLGKWVQTNSNKQNQVSCISVQVPTRGPWTPTTNTARLIQQTQLLHSSAVHVHLHHWPMLRFNFTRIFAVRYPGLRRLLSYQLYVTLRCDKDIVKVCPFLGPLFPIFRTSGDVSSGFRSQSRQSDLFQGP